MANMTLGGGQQLLCKSWSQAAVQQPEGSGSNFTGHTYNLENSRTHAQNLNKLINGLRTFVSDKVSVCMRPGILQIVGVADKFEPLSPGHQEPQD